MAAAVYDVKAVKRQWEGYETPLEWGRYPVEHEPIRRACHMLDDANPLYIDEGRCPPAMVDYFASMGTWPPREYDIIGLVRRIPTPGDRLINLNQEMEWFAMAKVGDRLGVRHKVLSVNLRGTRLDPLCVWIKTETTVLDRREQVVAIRSNHILVHRTPEEIAAGISHA
jgi:hypothetical protein